MILQLQFFQILFLCVFPEHMKEEVVVILSVVFVAFFNQMVLEVGAVLTVQTTVSTWNSVFDH